jgi:O-acetyl-ADP-ribose deacetylase (regulator of RNase III)
MIEVLKNDITKVKADAIVSAANGVGVAGAGVAGAICKAAGPSYKEEIRLAAQQRSGGYDAGQIYVTSAGDLIDHGVKNVIHAVTMKYPGGPTSYHTVESCLQEIIDEARRSDLGSVAVPGLGTGIGGLDSEVVAKQTVGFFQRHLREGDPKIIIIDIDPYFIRAAFDAIEKNTE